AGAPRRVSFAPRPHGARPRHLLPASSSVLPLESKDLHPSSRMGLRSFVRGPEERTRSTTGAFGEPGSQTPRDRALQTISSSHHGKRLLEATARAERLRSFVHHHPLARGPARSSRASSHLSR